MSEGTAAYAELFEKLERERGFRGALYRQKCLRRRLAVRMRARGVGTPEDYAAVLDSDPGEYEKLLRTLTINVSKFFRNAQTWEVIRRRVLVDLLSRGRRLCMWSAGSAAGEEAYSLAIVVLEALGDSVAKFRRRVRIVGTDIDGLSLEAARVGEYSEVALDETPDSIRRRWFTAEAPHRLRDPLPSLVEFRRLDILDRRPDFDADLILCRNLLIYLDRLAQRQVFRMFLDVLRPGGYLVLGRVETLNTTVRSSFEVVDSRERVFRRL